MVTRNPLCEFLGDGDVESAIDAMVRSNIEITDVPRYDLWFEQKFGIATGVRENVSQKILKLSELEPEDIPVITGFNRALSVRGAEFQSDRRLRATRPLTMCRRSSVLWRGLRARFSIVRRFIRNFLIALRVIDTGSSAEKARCGTPKADLGPDRLRSLTVKMACSHVDQAEQPRNGAKE